MSVSVFSALRAKLTAVLERHREIVGQKLGDIQSKILASDARLSHRITGRALSSRWLEIIALACTLRRWQDSLSGRRLSVLNSKQQENAAVLIQRTWRAHVSRMGDVRRTLSLAILRRNFRVLFFKHRIKRRVTHTHTHRTLERDKSNPCLRSCSVVCCFRFLLVV